MFRFDREKILPLFFASKQSINQLALSAGVSHRAADHAVNGERITSTVVQAVASALGINPLDYLLVLPSCKSPQ